jgi:chromosomal replication initiator protein
MIHDLKLANYSLGIGRPGHASEMVISQRLTVRRIQNEVAAYYRRHPDEMTSAQRSREVARPRQVAMYLSRRLSNKSYPHLGSLFRKDHSTVIHAVRQIEKLRADDKVLDRDIMRLTESLVAQ